MWPVISISYYLNWHAFSCFVLRSCCVDEPHDDVVWKILPAKKLFLPIPVIQSAGHYVTEQEFVENKYLQYNSCNSNSYNLKNHLNRILNKPSYESSLVTFFDHVSQIWRENTSILPWVVPKIMTASETRLTGRR